MNTLSIQNIADIIHSSNLSKSALFHNMAEYSILGESSHCNDEYALAEAIFNKLYKDKE